jgi:hypothetical protein
MGKIDYLARKRFSELWAAEEASHYVLEYLSADDWKHCCKFRGDSKPATFLYTVINNALEAFNRHRFGRPRAPLWVKDKGETWVKIWKMICLERHLSESVADTLTNTGLRTREFVYSAIELIKAKISWCGVGDVEVPERYLVTETNQNPLDSFSARDHSGSGASEGLEGEAVLLDAEELMARLYQLACSGNETNQKTLTDDKLLDRLRQNLDLDDEDWLILKMVYKDGFKLKVVAASLGMPAYLPGRKLKVIHEKIHDAMVVVGINLERIKEDALELI